eukprot:CAMPEP_0182546360 /NCGR_PEP_ID=MMETSP1323-20130603/35940_1 /TAXON_ID=236787 /ORGANISM="Florenciella parvula, Strain RCC1693" /LENGTH=208 /DNA_ID=CAMNT_0024757579 /DNA_START=98 /DNA_END=721 /DNA_ORIENTATION=+
MTTTRTRHRPPRSRVRVRGSICRLRESAASLRVPLQNCTRSSADLKTSALKRPVRRSNSRRPPRAEVKLAQDHQHGDDGREQQANDSPRRLRDVDDSRNFPRRHIDLGLRQPAAQRKGRPLAHLDVPLDSHRIRPLGDRVDHKPQLGQDEGQLVEQARGHKCGVKGQRLSKRLLAAADRARPKQQVLVNAVVIQKVGRCLSVAPVESV